jgi:hypothetical protein
VNSKTFIHYLFLLPLAFLTLHSAYSESVDVKNIIQFPTFFELPSNWRGQLDCRSTPGISIRAGIQLREDLIKRLGIKGISVNESSQRKASLYITDFTCGRDGIEDTTEIPLSLANFVDKSASFIARVILEIQDGRTSRLIDSKEIVVKGVIAEKENRILFFSSGTHYQDVIEPKVWEAFADEVVNALLKRETNEN